MRAWKSCSKARVAVFGIGGVGGYTVEALARSGVGTLDLIDDDKVCLTNINRQIIATRKTVGQYKVDVAEERVHDINPDAVVHTYKMFYTPETASQFDFTQYDYVVDAIDTVTGKIELVEQANRAGTPIISCMGAGNKLNAAAFEVSGHLQDLVLSARACYALRAAPPRHPEAQGGLFARAGDDADRRYGDQLSPELHLSAGYGAQVHPETSGSGQQRPLCLPQRD